MAYTSGSATDQYDLLDKFTTFVTTNSELVSLGQNWQLIKSEQIASYNLAMFTTDPVYTEDFLVKYFRAPGLSNQDSIYINILCYESLTAQIFNWLITGATGYDPLKIFEQQPGLTKGTATATPCTPCFTLINSQIDYWFVANGRRAIIIAKIGGDFFVTYFGFMLPYGKPSEHPYPLVISGNTSFLAKGYTDASLYNLYNNGSQDTKALVFYDAAHWALIGQTASAGQSSVVYCSCWPYDKIRSLTEAGNIRGNLDGSYSLLPCILYSSQEGFSGNWGELQGIYYLPGTGEADLTAEDTITIGSDTYLIVQNVDKATRNDFAAILLA